MNKPSSPVCIRHRFSASQETVFDAWVHPVVMRRWMFVGPKTESVAARTDRRVGGAFSILERTENGAFIDHFGQYRRIERPGRLVFTLAVPKLFLGVTCVSVQILPESSRRSVMTFTQTGVSREVTEDSWRMMFDRLERIFAAETNAPARRELIASAI